MILDLKKQYAIPVYDRHNIHKIKEEEFVLTIDDQFFFGNDPSQDQREFLCVFQKEGGD